MSTESPVATSDGSDLQIFEKATPQTPVPQPVFRSRKHSVWHIELVYIQVNGTVFSLPKDAFSGFPPSSPFAEIASVPTGRMSAIEGGTEERAIVLSDISEAEFDGFMRVIYPLPRITQPSTFEEWIGILRLANIWDYTSVRQQAITRLTPMIKDDPAAKLRLGKENDVQEWVRSGYINLLSNVDIGMKDPCHMDWETTETILDARRQSMVAIFLSTKKSILKSSCVYNPNLKARIGVFPCLTAKSLSRNAVGNVTTALNVGCGEDGSEPGLTH